MTIKPKSINKIAIFIFIFSNLIFAIVYFPALFFANNFSLALILAITGFIFGLFFTSIFIFFSKESFGIDNEELTYKNFFVNKKMKIYDIDSISLTTPVYLNPLENIFGTSPLNRLEVKSAEGKLSIDARSYDKGELRELFTKLKKMNKQILMDDFAENLTK